MVASSLAMEVMSNAVISRRKLDVYMHLAHGR